MEDLKKARDDPEFMQRWASDLGKEDHSHAGRLRRKHGQDLKRVVVSGFDNDIDKAITALQKEPCDGGNDLPEDVWGGLEAMLDLDWKNMTKVGICAQHAKHVEILPH